MSLARKGLVLEPFAPHQHKTCRCGFPKCTELDYFESKNGLKTSVELAASIFMYFGQDFDSLDGLRTNLQWQDEDSDPDVCFLAAGSAGPKRRTVFWHMLPERSQKDPKGSKGYAVVVHSSLFHIPLVAIVFKC